MVGTGVFTSLGYQVADIQTGFSIVLLWVLGGVLALCGATTYTELGSALPRSGGEYTILSKLIHPAMGFIAGWISVTVGFAAPASLAAIALASYLQTLVPDLPVNHVAASFILILGIIHAFSLRTGLQVQNYSTAFKILLMITLIVAGFMVGNEAVDITVLPQASSVGEIFSGPFAVSLIFVSYAFVETGWVAAALYIADHMFFAMAIGINSYFHKIADPKDIASTAGVSFTINHIAAVVIPVLFGLLWMQSSSLVFLAGAVLAAISLGLALLVPSREILLQTEQSVN